MNKAPCSCKICSRRTAAGIHGGDAAGCGLCIQCYELAGWENSQSDNAGLSVEERGYVLNEIVGLGTYPGTAAAVAKWNKVFGMEVIPTPEAAKTPAAKTGQANKGVQHKVNVHIGERVCGFPSTYQAFLGLGLPVAKHVKFRKELKLAGKKTFVCERGAHHLFEIV